MEALVKEIYKNGYLETMHHEKYVESINDCEDPPKRNTFFF